MRRIRLGFKRTLDICAAIVALALLSPLLVAVAIGIKLASPGPVFFRQKRLGKDGKVFRIFKFRTMHHEAPVLTNPDGSVYTGQDDPRVFGFGTMLRRFSIDEIPQFINVLLGEMSVVGPRPDMEEHLKEYAPGQERKLEMKPGITGWAMVNGRNSIPWERRIELDVWYIDHHSLWLDFKTALLTVPTLLFGRGVHQAGPQR